MKTSSLLKAALAVSVLLAGSDSLRAKTLTFQDGVNGYAGTHDTIIRGATPDRVDGALAGVSIDGSDGGGANHGLIRFDNIFGDGANQIPKGSVIISVTLTLVLFDPGSPANIHKMLKPWDEATATWNLINPAGDGIVADGVLAAVEQEIPQFTTPVGELVLKLPPGTVQAWLDGTAPNYGWAFIPTGGNGWDIRTSEFGTVALRPKLTVVYGLPGQPVLSTFLPHPIGFIAQIEDSTPPAGVVSQASISVTFDGNKITPQISKAGTTTTLSYVAPAPFAVNSSHTATFEFTDSSTPPKAQTDPNTFVVAAYTAIPAEYAVTAVDTSKPGFKVRVFQTPHARFPGNRGLNANADRALALGYIDPVTGKPYANTADLSLYGPDGFFVESGVINFNEAAPTAAGNFSADTTPAFEDKPFPGIPGSGLATTDFYVTEVLTLVELKRGSYRFGVSSDDGFKLAALRNPRDAVGLILGQQDGTRGTADTIFNFVAPVDGFYPLRLIHNENGGGSTLELYAVDLLSGEKTLINNPNGATPIRAFREGAASRPFVSRVLPTQNYLFTFADDDLTVEITDGATGVEPNSVSLTLNGTAVSATPAKSGRVTAVSRKGSLSNLLPAGANNVRLVYSFTEQANTVSVTNTWTYTVPAYTPIPPANKVAANTVSGSGFKARSHQIDRSLDANQGNGGRYTGQSGGGNNMPRPEIQIINGYINRTNNTPYPNLAEKGPNPDGSFDLGTLNHNLASGANIGIFQGSSDLPVPGLPGAGSSQSGQDNFASEIITYLSLKAGAQLFAVNCDDGFTVSSAPNPRDTLGTFIRARNPGGGQNTPLNSANAVFNVVVLEDGVYPIRILWWQGGGGVNIEFLTVDRNTGQELLVNDVGRAAAPAAQGVLDLPGTVITAFNTYTGPVRPWVKFSVYPMPSLWHNQHQQSGPGPIQVKVGAGNPADIANDHPTNIRPFGDAIGAIVADLGTGSVGMVVDGVSVTPTVTDVSGTTDKRVLYTPNPPFASGSTHTAGLVYAGTTNYWTFTVITNVTVPPGLALPVSAADQNASGFRVKVAQAATGSTLANTMARAETQLAGTPASVALPGPNPDGSYTVPGIINWNVTQSPGGTPTEIGNFQPLLTGTPDDPVPGIPGTGLSGAAQFENIAAEIFAYLDLPAGYQKFGVNGDDGWTVHVAKPGQTSGTVLFTIDRGAGARDIPFAFITPEAGLYPIRLVWYQGAGGGNVEFFSYGPNNEKIAINDRKNPNAIKAYYNATGVTPTPTPKFSSIRVNANGSITLEWTGGGTLESAAAVTGPWAPVAGAASPFTFTPTLQAQFGRIRQ